MSNQLAIATVTETLRRLIEAAIQLDDGAAVCVTRPPDRVNPSTNRLNLFLYHAEIDAAFRNRVDLNRQTLPGESAEPPLPLCLYYLLSAYGSEQDAGDITAHRLIGRASLTLHDHPILSATEIQAALPGTDLHEQIERVRITPMSLSLEEMSRLWGSFSTNYRLSMAYKVSLVLIDSTRPTRTPLPVLTIRTTDGRGLQVQPSLVPPYPTLTNVTLPANRTGAALGDAITLEGYHLDGTTVTVQMTHPMLSSPILIPQASFTSASSTAITFPLPSAGNAPSQFAAGFFTITVVTVKAGVTRSTNALYLPLAPTIQSRAPASAPAGNINLAVTCVPQVRVTQSVSLLFGSREIAPQPFVLPANPSAASALQFNVAGATTGDHFLRLRVDGVDSNLIILAGVPPAPQFDPNQKVTIT